MTYRIRYFFADLWGAVSTCTLIAVIFDVQVWVPMIGGLIALGIEYLKYKNKSLPIEILNVRLGNLEKMILSRPCILESELNCDDELTKQ